MSLKNSYKQATGAEAPLDLAAIRAKLAQGGGGQVNPPEMGKALTEGAFEPKTEETPEGLVPMVSATAPEATPQTALPAPAKRTRRTKAEIEAANATSFQPRTVIIDGMPVLVGAAVQASMAAQAAEGRAQAAASLGSVAAYLQSIPTDDLLREIFRRVSGS
jgi:hypothetical protein